MPSVRASTSRAVLLTAALSACTTYEVARMEFDSISGFDRAAAGEPEQVEYRHEVTRWPWAVRQVEGSGLDWLIAVTAGARPGPSEVDDPAGLMREQLAAMAELSLGDFGRMADTAHRLLWVAARDESALDQIVALAGISSILATMGVDPLEVPFPSADPVAATESVESALRTIDALQPAARGGAPLDDAERRRYAAALRAVAARPSGSAAQGRATIRTLLRVTAAEPDRVLREAARVALADAMACEMAQTVRVKMASTDPAVREEALLVLHRLSGPIAVPFSLRVLATRPSGGAWRYDPDESFRRTWVRLCAQLPPGMVDVSYDGGPRPLEFLYDTATRDESAGLRLVALDALARALQRPVSLDPDWADAWWKELALEPGARLPDGEGPAPERRR